MLFNPKYEDRRDRAPDEPLPTWHSLLPALKPILRVTAAMLAIVGIVTAIVAVKTWMWMPHSGL
jgi:hypothetical protein